jgi:hypothetical protein
MNAVTSARRPLPLSPASLHAPFRLAATNHGPAGPVRVLIHPA